jgi:hypothetical protein
MLSGIRYQRINTMKGQTSWDKFLLLAYFRMAGALWRAQDLWS